MTVFSVLMVASMLMLLPLALFNFSVMRLSMLLFVNSVLSMFRTASLKVIVILPLTPIPAVPLTGLNVTVGAVLSVPPGFPPPVLSSPSSSPSAVPTDCRVMSNFRLLVFVPMEKGCDSP